MTADDRSELANEFLKNQRRMTRLLRDVVVRLEDGDVEVARSLADELDNVAGPHIAFEESILYPAVGGVEGEAFQQQLLGEHEQARAGLSALLSADDSSLSEGDYRRNIVAALRAGLKHAESCGTLVTHLEELTDDQQRLGLERLDELRQAGGRWTAGTR